MIIFKNYFRIIKKNRIVIMIYIGIFIVLGFFISITNEQNFGGGFIGYKTNIALINRDGNSEFYNGLKNYLGKNENIVSLPDHKQALQDALFFSRVDYILIIPRGFSSSLMTGNPAKLQKTVAAGSTDEVFTDMVVNRYINTSRSYIHNVPGITALQLRQYVASDLDKKSSLAMNASASLPPRIQSARSYYTAITYSIMAILILCVTTCLKVYNDPDLKRRSQCAPVKPVSINIQLILGNIVLAAAAWLIVCLFSFVLFGKNILNRNGALFIINLFVFTITAMALAFLLGHFIKNFNAQQSVCNVITLGLSFISGVFVPQSFLSPQVLSIARFTPTYWYVKSINDISVLSTFNSTSIKPILICIFIQLCFAAAFFAAAMLIVKKRKAVSY